MAIEKIAQGDEVTIKKRVISVDEDHPVGFPKDVVGKVLGVDRGYAVVSIPEFNVRATYDTIDLKRYPKN